MSTRRGSGEGALYQRHDHPTCPPIGEDGERPEHRCRGRWVKTIDFGWSAGKRQRKALYGKTKAEVIDKEKELRRSTRDVAPNSAHTVESWITYWLNNIAIQRWRPQTTRNAAGKINGYIIPLLGRHRLDKLEPRHVRDMYDRMRMPCPSPTETGKCEHSPSHGLAEGTLRQTHAILSRALKIAVRERLVNENVATLIDPPATTTKKRDRLTTAEARLVLATAEHHTDPSRWWVAFHEGMRQGECLGLAWEMVNLDEGTITVARTLIKAPGGLAFGDPKSETSKRTIPMTPQVRAQLTVHWARYVEACRARGEEPDRASLVWCQANGRPIGHKADWKRWKALLEAAGVRHVALHSARNTTAAILEEARVPARLAAEILGHSDVSMTYAYQANAGLENRRRAMDALEATWSASDVDDRSDGAVA